MTSGTGICNGSFGEILQGVLPGGRKFLVNLPITTLSDAVVTLTDPTYDPAKESAFAALYARYPKACKAVRCLLGKQNRWWDFTLDIQSGLPWGKGLSSSTADMVAVMRAAGEAVGTPLTPGICDEVLRLIEPNDGVQYPGTAVYAHEEGELIAQYDYVPSWRILGIDSGGTVDTVEFNRRPRVWNKSNMDWWEAKLGDTVRALRQQDGDQLARIATYSTEFWQQTHPKSQYAQVEDLASDTQALGIVNTHSGTYLGLIYPADENHESADQRINAQVLAQERMPECTLRWFETKGVA